jgi:branched-chain amino acid transport system ATP-binding protein
MAKKRPETKMVPLPSESIIPERDLGLNPVLETRYLSIDFGGLKALDNFNIAVGRSRQNYGF